MRATDMKSRSLILEPCARGTDRAAHPAAAVGRSGGRRQPELRPAAAAHEVPMPPLVAVPVREDMPRSRLSFAIDAMPVFRSFCSWESRGL